jgi:hypothetical protein
MLADWMVIPLSRSAGRKSVVVLPVSTEPGIEMNSEACNIDSVRVVLPESLKVSHRQGRAITKLTYVRHQGYIADLDCICMGLSDCLKTCLGWEKPFFGYVARELEHLRRKGHWFKFGSCSGWRQVGLAGKLDQDHSRHDE